MTTIISSINNINSSFTRQQVEAEPLVKLTDTMDNLDLFCYTKCEDMDSDFVKMCRGIVYSGDQLVMKSFPYTMEYSSNEREVVKSILDTNWKFYLSYEGALIRMFYFNGKWYTSTHRKLDAFRSKWSSSESFGTMFVNALTHKKTTDQSFATRLEQQLETFSENVLEQFQTILNKQHQYMFLVCNTTENRIVCKSPDHPTAYHIGTFIDGKFDPTDNIGFDKPREFHFDTVDQMLEYVSAQIDPHQHQGLVAIDQTNNKQIKVITPRYQELFRVRGNEPSVKFRYLQVRLNTKLSTQLIELYPEYKEDFAEYERILDEVGNRIYNAYVDRFIRKMFVTVPQEEFQVIRECHDWHLSNRITNRISVEQVTRVLNAQLPVNLNHMIRHYKLEHKTQ